MISLGGCVISKSLRIGGDKLDECIMRYLRKQYNLAIGEQMAENLKIMIGSCLPDGEENNMTLKGRDLVQGLPRQIEINSRSVCSAIIERIQAIVDGVKNVLEMTPPELSADIIDQPLVSVRPMLTALATISRVDCGAALETAMPPCLSQV